MSVNDLDNPEYRAFARRRFVKVMGWMTLASLATALIAVWVLAETLEKLPLFMAVATGIGVFLTVLLCAFLMSLVFFSAGSGHDDKIRDPYEDDIR